MSTARKFGWFGGVFTPSILTILGVIMYLRLPAIVGQAGLITTLGIIALAHVISITTGLSVASVATDRKVEGGGTYYVISRSLGLSIGGTLGVALFVGLSFAVSLYIVGFAESFLGFLGIEQSVPNIRIAGTLVLLGVTVVTFISTSLALRTQFFVLAAIALSFVSIFAGFGGHEFTAVSPEPGTLPDAAPFIVLFAIFFPAVTGFEAGVSMSGDLRDPKRAIPLGAISAILVGLVVYAAMTVFLATTVSADALVDDPNILADIALVGPLVLAGVWGATISSALGSILGAPRILQATSADRVTPRFFAAGSGRAKEPRRALIITFLIAWGGILLGELDTIARVVSMFFIATYGFLNLACAIESWASPDFRPAMRVPRWVSVLGAVACLVVMILLDVIAMIAATLILGLLYFALARRQLRLEAGDAWQGFWSSVARAALHRLDRNPSHTRHWRPNLLMFAGPEGGRSHLLEFGRELTGKRGMLTNFHLVERPDLGDEASGVEPADLDGEEPPYGVFTRQVQCQDVYSGMADVARYYGYSGVEPNTVLLGWPRRAGQEEGAARMVRRFADLDYNVLLLDYKADRGFGDRARIDFWALPGTEQVGLMMALAGYLGASDPWRNAELRFILAAEGGAAHTGARRLAARLEAERLPGAVRVVARPRGAAALAGLIAAESADAELTVVGLPDVGGIRSGAGIAAATAVLDGLGSALLVHASRDLRDRRPVVDRTDDAPRREGVAEPADELTALDLPQDPRLAAAVTGLDDPLQERAAELIDGPLTAAYADLGRLAESVSRVIQEVAAVAREAGDGDRARGLHELRKARGEFHYHAHALLASYADEGVTAQSDALSTIADRLLESGHELIEASSRRLRTADDQSIPWRRLVAGHLEARIPRAGLTVADDLAADAARAVARSRAWLADAVAALDAVEDDLADRDADAARSAMAALDAATAESAESARAQGAAAGQAGAALRGALRAATTGIAAALKQVASGGRLPRARRGGAAAGLADRLRDQVAVWGQNQRLIARTATVDLELLAFQHRVRTVVRRELAEFELEILNEVAGRIEAVDEALAEHAERARADPGAEFTRTFESWSLPSVHAFLDRLMDELGRATGDLPESAEILADPAAGARTTAETTAADGLELALRSLVELRLESDLMGPVREALDDADVVLRRAEDTARDAVRLAAVQLREPNAADPAADTGVAMLESARGRLGAARDSVLDLRARIRAAVTRRLEAAFAVLTAHELARSAGRAPGQARALKGIEALSWVERERVRARRTIAEQVGRLFYQRSETLLAARGLERRADGHAGTVIPRLMSTIRPDPAVLDALPHHYRQLFLGNPVYARDFWVGWQGERTLAESAVAGHRRGLGGGVAIVGEPYGGKSALARWVADEHFDRDRVFSVAPPAERSTDPDVFHDRLRDAIGPASVGRADPLAALDGALVVVEDVDLWWERCETGYDTIREILRLIRTHGDRVLFLLTADVHAFRFISGGEALRGELLSVIECEPFNAREIGDVIDLRHTSTGLVFEYDGRAEEDLSAWRRARLFNRFFDYSRGSMGTALHAWIAHIRRVDGDRLVIAAPTRPELDVLDVLTPTQLLLLVQLILHRALDRHALARLCPVEPDALDRDLGIMLRAGLLHEPRPGRIAIDPFLRPHLIWWCVDRELVP